MGSANLKNHSLEFPKGFDDYASELESKGWFSEARLSFLGKKYRLSFYDPARLGQEVDADIQRGGVFFEPNIVVIPSLTRSNMEDAVAQLVESGGVNSLIAE